MVAQSKPRRNFVPVDFDPADWSQIEPLLARLQSAQPASPAELEAWLAQLSELTAAVDEHGARKYIDKSCHTEDKAIEAAYMHFVEEIEPKLKPAFFALQKKFLDSPYHTALTGQRYEILKRKWQADVDLFRPENVALETQITRLVTDYDKISGAMMVEFEGKQLTMPQLGRYQERVDRDLRQRAFEAGAKRRLQDRERIEKLFDEILPLRRQIAKNADCEDYREFTWKALKRFDYTPADCDQFADAVEKAVVPLVKTLDQQRMEVMGLDTLRPWDLSVDPKNREPLHPFAENDIEGFVTKTRQMFERMSPALADEFETLRTHNNLDLDSRRGKQPGGYQSSLEESQQPFIFMNAAGAQRDVETLLHEGGHAFHFLAAAANEPLVFLRSAPMEFCEVASMSMEALGSEHYDIFYSPEDAARAKRTYFEGVIRILPWIAIIDQFQHWIYTHPDHADAEREKVWLGLLTRFGSIVDWSGYEDVKAASWQRQLHLFHVPFYYIEYGIAQLGALQLWMKAKEDPQRALANYRSALKLGGTRPLPQLFSAAGLRFDFSRQTIEPLMNAIGEELESLPA
ncbi:MAG TPA: M3 family oligoendopeptidase [Tepidisphaeraceae bacterium]|jgi:oligoendopeptidase F